jgi:hypothetical protein
MCRLRSELNGLCCQFWVGAGRGGGGGVGGKGQIADLPESSFEDMVLHDLKRSIAGTGVPQEGRGKILKGCGQLSQLREGIEKLLGHPHSGVTGSCMV